MVLMGIIELVHCILLLLYGKQVVKAGVLFKNGEPLFNSPSSNNYQPTNGVINDIGTPLAVVDDIVNATRSTSTPDIGAYEFTCAPLAGNYSINPSVAQSATNFHTFEEAICALKNCGISAAVVIDVASGQTFNEQISIPEITGASAANTITFNGNGSTLTYTTSSTTSFYTLMLFGADYFIFKNFKCYYGRS